MLPHLADWLCGLFSPENLDRTCELLATVDDYVPSDDVVLRDEAKKRLADAEAKIRRCESLLLTDADEATLVRWLNEATAEREAANRLLATSPRVELGMTTAR